MMEIRCFNFDRIARRDWLVLVLTFLAVSLLINWENNQVAGIYEPPYSLNVHAETVVNDLGDCGVSFVFVPDGKIFCSELKTGKVRVIENFQLLPEPLIELDIYHSSKPDGRFDERGLTGITIDPEFEKNHYVYLHWTYLDPDDQKSYNRVARFTESNNKLTNMTIILDKVPSEFQHNGGPLEFGLDGKLYITGGEATQRKQAQSMNSSLGKIFRINSDGSIPEDNPFPRLPYYTIGHRNVFGIGFHPVTKMPYATENGPTEKDEVNMLIAGKNYGWPDVVGKSGDKRFIDPLLEFTPTIVPTELIFYTGDKYPHEVNNMFFVSWAEHALFRVVLKPPNYDEVLSVDMFPIPKERGLGSLTDIEQGPDGYLYVSAFKNIIRLGFEYTNITSTISLDVEYNADANKSIILKAKVSDYFGHILHDVLIDFYDSDKLIGSSLSNQEGIARFEYTPDAEGQHIFNARFDGDEKHTTSYSPQRLLRVDGSLTEPMLQSVINDDITVRLSWDPSEPAAGIPTRFNLEFVDAKTGNLLDDVKYDFVIIRGNTVLVSKADQIATQGHDFQEFTFDAMQIGSMQVVVESVNNKNDSVMFTINVIPEFPAYVSILIMTVILAVSTILMNYKRFVKHFDRSFTKRWVP